MKKLMSLMVGMVFVFVALGTSVVWGKGHVKINKIQTCRDGKVREHNANRLQRQLDRGACMLPVCDFNNIFQKGDECDDTDEAPEDGFCDNLNARDSANRFDNPPGTPACSSGNF